MIMLVSGFINGLRKVMNGTDTEWQQRTELLLGEDKMLRLRNSHVLVVGLGGVGAYAAEMICRAGVGQYLPPVAGFAFHTGTAEGGSIGRAFQRYQSRFETECVVGIFER